MIQIVSSSASDALAVTPFSTNQTTSSSISWVRHIYPKNVYELPETLFGKLQEFNLQFLKKKQVFQ